MQGLAYLTLDDAGIVRRVLADPRLLRLPLVRHGNAVTVGLDEATWAGWLKPGGRALNAVQPTAMPRTMSPAPAIAHVVIADHEAGALQDTRGPGRSRRPGEDEDSRDDPPSAHRHLPDVILAAWPTRRPMS